MLPGRVTPALLLQWEEHAIAYFDKVKTAEADKVSSVLTCWRDSEIDNFIKMNKARFRTEDFTFPMFMTEIRNRFLDPLWHKHIMRSVVNSKMERSESFSQFANRVIAGNNLLEGTGSRLNSTDLRAKLIDNMSMFLASKLDRLKTAEQDRLAAIVPFEEWMREIVTIDNDATSDLKRIADMLREEPDFKRPRLEVSSSQSQPFHPSQVPNMPVPNTFRGTGANAIRPSFPPPTNGFSQTTSGRKRCPPLSQVEIALLNKHKGCRKCRRFYVSHRGFACPNDFPDGTNYVPLSEEMAFEAMRKLAVASTFNGSFSDNSPVIITTHSPSVLQQPSFPSSSFSNAYNTFFAPASIPYSTPAPSVSETPSAHIEDVPNSPTESFSNPPAAVGAVLPSSSFQPFALLGPGDGDTSTEDVSPLSCPHLIWRSQIWNSNDVQVPYDCLLDDGAHLVLIRPETVTDLGLPIRRLSEPLSVTLALNNDPDTVTDLWDYILLSLSSLNNSWSSKPVRALVAPGLCSNILLGLPFLVHNKIVIDHEARTAVDKTSGFDLLNENTTCRVAKPSSPSLSPKQKRLLILKHKRNVLSELKLKCSQRLDFLNSNNLFENLIPSLLLQTIYNLSLARRNFLNWKKILKMNIKTYSVPFLTSLSSPQTKRLVFN